MKLRSSSEYQSSKTEEESQETSSDHVELKPERLLQRFDVSSSSANQQQSSQKQAIGESASNRSYGAGSIPVNRDHSYSRKMKQSAFEKADVEYSSDNHHEDSNDSVASSGSNNLLSNLVQKRQWEKLNATVVELTSVGAIPDRCADADRTSQEKDSIESEVFMRADCEPMETDVIAVEDADKTDILHADVNAELKCMEVDSSVEIHMSNDQTSHCESNDLISDDGTEKVDREGSQNASSSKDTKKKARRTSNGVVAKTCDQLSASSLDEMPVRRRSDRIRSLEEKKEKVKDPAPKKERPPKTPKQETKKKPEIKQEKLEVKSENVPTVEPEIPEMKAVVVYTPEEPKIASVVKNESKDDTLQVASSPVASNDNALVVPPPPPAETKIMPPPVADVKREDDVIVKPEKVKSRWRRSSEMESVLTTNVPVANVVTLPPIVEDLLVNPPPPPPPPPPVVTPPVPAALPLNLENKTFASPAPGPPPPEPASPAQVPVPVVSSAGQPQPSANSPLLPTPGQPLPVAQTTTPSSSPSSLVPLKTAAPAPETGKALLPTPPPPVPPDPEPQSPTFELIDENIYLFDRRRSKSKKEVRRMLCDCMLTKEERENGVMGCTQGCLNRLLMIECGSRCLLGDACSNKAFQKKLYARTEPFKTEKKGWGLRALEDVSSSTFVMEYVGEVLSPVEFKQRVKHYAKEKNDHYYFMALKGDEILDATTKGNGSRFINHSCDPNCETQKWTVNGELHIGFFTKRDIKAFDELTFDYQFQRYGREAQRCYCESSNCRGFIGGDTQISLKSGKNYVQKKQRNRNEGRKREVLEDLAMKEELEKLSGSGGLRNQEQTLTLARLMVKAEDNEIRQQLLDIILNTTEQACLRLFLDYHGLSLLWSWMVDLGDDAMHLKAQVLQVLASLPISNKTMLLDSKVFNVVQRWAAQSLSSPPPTKLETTEPQVAQEASAPTASSSAEESNKTAATVTSTVATTTVSTVTTAASTITTAVTTTISTVTTAVSTATVSTTTPTSTEGVFNSESYVIEDLDSIPLPPMPPPAADENTKNKSLETEKEGMECKSESESFPSPTFESPSKTLVTAEDKKESGKEPGTTQEGPAKKVDENGLSRSDSDESHDMAEEEEEGNSSSSSSCSNTNHNNNGNIEGNCKQDIGNLAAKILESWSSLKEVFRIPRVEQEKRREDERAAAEQNYHQQQYLSGQEWESSPPRSAKHDSSPSPSRSRKRHKETPEPERNRNRLPLLPTPPKLSKEERRQLFAMEVQQRDQEEALRRQKHLSSMAVPQMSYVYDPATGTGYSTITYNSGLGYPIDPNTGYPLQPVPSVEQYSGTGDPNAGYPTAVDPNVVYPAPVDPNAGYPTSVDPNVGYSATVDPGAGYPAPVDPNAGYPAPVDPGIGYATSVDPNTGYALQGTPVDPNTGYPLQATPVNTSTGFTVQSTTVDPNPLYPVQQQQQQACLVDPNTGFSVQVPSTVAQEDGPLLGPASVVATSVLPGYTSATSFVPSPSPVPSTQQISYLPPVVATACPSGEGPLLPGAPPGGAAPAFHHHPGASPSLVAGSPLVCSSPSLLSQQPLPQASALPAVVTHSGHATSFVSPAAATQPFLAATPANSARQPATQLYYVQSTGAVVPLPPDQSLAAVPNNLGPLVHVAVAPSTSEDVAVPPKPPKPPTKLPPYWKTAKDEEGNIYYYHSLTRETQWDPPTGDDEDDGDSMDLGTPTFDEPKVGIRIKHHPSSSSSSSSSKKKTTTAAADTSSEVAKKIKELFRSKMSGYIVQCLNPYRKLDCKVGRISNTEDFKHLARKLTHFVMSKELKYCKNVEDLECNENVKHKAKDFVHKYMSKYGLEYRKDKHGSPRTV